MPVTRPATCSVAGWDAGSCSPTGLACASPRARLLQIEEFFARYGLAAILIGRFAGLVRGVAPFLAGPSRYPPRRLIALAALGTGVWSVEFVCLGYLFWQSLDRDRHRHRTARLPSQSLSFPLSRWSLLPVCT